MNDKRKILLTESKMKELQGFEDVIDLLFDDKRIISNQEARANKDDTFEIYSFLEKELRRLQHLDRFFSTQMRTHEFYSQTSELCERQSDKLSSNRDELIGKLIVEDSPLHHNLEELIKKSF